MKTFDGSAAFLSGRELAWLRHFSITAMNRIRPSLGLLIVAMFASIVAAQDASSPAAVVSTPSPAASAVRTERIVSPHLAELLAATMPKYKPIAEKPEPVVSTDRESEKPSNGIVRLPRIIVSDAKLPKPLEILTRKGLEHRAMEQYIGPEDGLDRGVLNLFTIAGIWKKIPVLGSFPFLTSETNVERGMRLYDAAEQKRKMDELRGLMNLKKEAGDVPGSEK